MKKVVKLTERDLNNIVKRVMKENIYSQEDLEMMRDPEHQKYSKYVPVGKDFRNELMKLLYNAEESNEEKISILRDILDKLESGEE
jgi:hypothetical protein